VGAIIQLAAIRSTAIDSFANLSTCSSSNYAASIRNYGNLNKKMHTTDHSVEEVLKEARRFIVPLYQRKYQWDGERLDPFWEDVEAKASEVRNNESKFEHYMGALILSPVDIGSGIGRTPIL
jgi:uncharacterized protein with ParB-like and HNH nuclease domain